jgi:hypothetical protein
LLAKKLWRNDQLLSITTRIRSTPVVAFGSRLFLLGLSLQHFVQSAAPRPGLELKIGEYRVNIS